MVEMPLQRGSAASRGRCISAASAMAKFRHPGRLMSMLVLVLVLVSVSMVLL